MMNSVTVFSSLSFRSAIMGYVHMLGFALNQSWSGMTSTLISSVVLMCMSATVQDCGGTFLFFFSDTNDLDGDCYSAVSAINSLFCVNWWVFTLVHDIPMQFWIEKSLPRIIGLFKGLHTINVW